MKYKLFIRMLCANTNRQTLKFLKQTAAGAPCKCVSSSFSIC